MSFWTKRDTNQMPAMLGNNFASIQQKYTNIAKDQSINQSKSTYSAYNNFKIEVESSENDFSLNHPSLTESQSQSSTDGSSSSSCINSLEYNSLIPSLQFKNNFTSIQQSFTPFAHPLPKTQTNEDVYFPRVFSNNMMEVQESTDFLSRHSITASMRSKMIDWMIEVLKAYSYQETTFSLSVAIMDAYFANVKRSLGVGELHVIGVTSMYIASKYEEISPLSLQKVYEKIAHQKISMAAIRQTEADILNTLNFCLTFPTLDILSNVMIKYLDLHDFFHPFNEEIRLFFRKLSVYMYKLATIDYELMSQYNYKVIAVSSVFVSIKVMEQYFPDFCQYYYFEQLLEIIGLKYTAILQPCTKLLTLAKQYEQFYPNLKNIKKYNLAEINYTQPQLTKLYEQSKSNQNEQNPQQPQENQQQEQTIEEEQIQVKMLSTKSKSNSSKQVTQKQKQRMYIYNNKVNLVPQTFSETQQ